MPSTELLLQPEIQEIDKLEKDCYELRTISRAKYFKRVVFLLTQVTLLLLCSAICVLVIRINSKQCAPPLNAIDNLSIKQQLYTYSFFEHSPYAGLPSADIEEAWGRLLEPMSIRVSENELIRNNQTSVPLPDGGGFLAWLEIFHELHCVKVLRQWKYKSHYFPNLTAGENAHIEKHTDHCLDRIRASLMCQPDIRSLTTFFWDDEPKPKVDRQRTLHQCIDWNALMDSISYRIVGREEVAGLVNPVL